MDDRYIPTVHRDHKVTRRGKKYYIAEITDNAGTHRILLNVKKVETGEIKVRNPNG